MIHSMTAYARKEFKGDWGTAVWEIRSVNQRYLETYIRLPEQLRSLEPVLRERFRAKLQRGKVECNLRFEAAQAAASQLHINEDLAKLIIDSANWVMKKRARASSTRSTCCAGRVSWPPPNRIWTRSPPSCSAGSIRPWKISLPPAPAKVPTSRT